MYPVKYVYVTMPFGQRGSWAAGYHTGVDFRASVGTALYATRGGTVIHKGWGGKGSAYGYHVVLRCRTRLGQTRHVLYAHMSSSPVYVGQKVKMGDYIGRSGDTGRTFGAHLHYEERKSPFGYYNHVTPVFLSYKPIISPTVYLSKLKPGKKNRSVRIVQRRLNRRKGIGPDIPVTSYFGKMTRTKYRRWQEKLGASGAQADGIPGRFSLEKLGLRVKP
jgi:murein DD-endopeptidase MepM/ murein hydrolase activator NlpD